MATEIYSSVTTVPNYQKSSKVYLNHVPFLKLVKNLKQLYSACNVKVSIQSMSATPHAIIEHTVAVESVAGKLCCKDRQSCEHFGQDLRLSWGSMYCL